MVPRFALCDYFDCFVLKRNQSFQIFVGGVSPNCDTVQ